ncbi:MAG: hypothetical protein GXY32_07570 [Ruminococcaceae bacterium]|nr:hypothetical protein [Oscillospiraceae bacterium]
MERYEDLTKNGMDAEEALRSVMASIGNVDELVAALPDEGQSVRLPISDEQRARSARTVTIAIGLYILAGVVFFIGVFLGGVVWDYAVLLGLILAAAICIIPTYMLV